MYVRNQLIFAMAPVLDISLKSSIPEDWITDPTTRRSASESK